MSAQLKNWWDRVLCFIRCHDWEYQDWVDPNEPKIRYFDKRTCKLCGHWQKFVACPAAPGGFTAWVDEDEW